MSNRFLALISIPIALALAIHADFAIANEKKNPDPQSVFTNPDLWQTLDGKPATKTWDFVDGEIRLTKPQGGNGSIISPPLPSNFELSFEWKIDNKTNTGLKYRVRRFGKHLFSNRYLGIEYQIIDDAADNVSKGSTASIYDLISPSNAKTLKPVGQWNQAKITAVGDRLEHYLNGRLVASTVTRGPQWDKAIALSKFFGAVDFGRPGDGDRIMLTDHGGKAAYRHFRFVTVDEVTDATNADDRGPYLANGMRNSWADQNSIVIWTRTTKNKAMNTAGKRFISVTKNGTQNLTDAKQIHAKQIPEGFELEDMFGACPGAKGKVRLTYFAGKQRNAAKSTDWISTTAKNDFTAQWKLENLKPNTQYVVVVEASAADSSEATAVLRGGFRTAPRDDETQNLVFCMTTCHDFIRRDDGLQGHQIYTAMPKLEPDFVVHAGDIEYYDKPDPWAMTIDLMRFKWGRIFALPKNREFYSNNTSYFIKDDHDTLKNDCWVGQRYGAVTFEQGVRLFNEEQFPSHPTRYKTVRWGRDLQIWILEGRDYRSPNNMPDGPNKSILGKKQKAWLIKTLHDSDATFKLVFSPTPVVGPDRANKKDNHANTIFAYEGQELRSELAKIDNVIVLCGDRHWQYASVDSETQLWEFGCGPGSEKHQLGWKPGDKRPVHQFLRVKGGFLSGELRYSGKDRQPKLTLQHRTVQGKAVSEFRFPVQPESTETKKPTQN